MMPENESEKYFALLKKVLSGSLGKNLIDITFRTQQVVDSPEHKLLTRLKDSQLKDEEALDSFYGKVMESVTLDSAYLILIGADAYDVPFKGKDDRLNPDGSGETYRYILCAVCPEAEQVRPGIQGGDQGVPRQCRDPAAQRAGAGLPVPGL